MIRGGHPATAKSALGVPGRRCFLRHDSASQRVDRSRGVGAAWSSGPRSGRAMAWVRALARRGSAKPQMAKPGRRGLPGLRP